MPTYRGTSETGGAASITSPQPLTLEQIGGVLSGELSLPGVTVDRGGGGGALPPREAAPASPPRSSLWPGSKDWAYSAPSPSPPSGRDTAFGTDILRPGETAKEFSDPSLWPGGKPPFATSFSEMGRNLKANAPEIVTDAALTFIPGSGLVKSGLRAAGATAAGVTTDALTGGKDLAGRALKLGATALGGELLGGGARAATRWGQDMFSQTTNKVGTILGDLIPAFRGGTRETINRIITGEGRLQLGDDYGTVVSGVLKAHGDPVVMVPSLGKLGGIVDQRASEALKAIQSAKRALFGKGGDFTRRESGLQDAKWLEDATDELHRQLQQRIGGPGVAVMDQAKANYARGMTIVNMLAEGHEHMSPAAVKSLIEKGRINEPGLEGAFQLSTGNLKQRFTPQEYAQLDKAIRRGERNPLAMSRVGKEARVGMVPGARLPHVSFPHLPVRIGRPEEVADAMARVFRLLGAGGGQLMLNDGEP